MDPEEETNGWTQGPPRPERTDTIAELDGDDIMEMYANLKGLKMVITEAQREVEALQQRIEDFKASGHPGANPYFRGLPKGRVLPDPPMPEPGSALARGLAEARARVDRTLIGRGLRYLEKVLTVERLLRRET
ncbi:hypothetical protein NW768_004833 [Fusarium equiseti]|uniref:Uncharacterized protein n=1 Tax=Fusarium equiseti TaxID=61235 RepID=A0ABQ8RHE4_FUSEQ|nr:hypothetical protein NW768_004833 [Fusarium equiseti]